MLPMAAMRGVMVPLQDKASMIAKRKGCLGRFAAWAGLLALVLQILLPLAQARAALPVDQDLAASICHSGTDEGGGIPAKPAHDHCQFCQIHTGSKLLLPTLSWTMPSRPAALFTMVAPPDTGPAGSPDRLAHPQRGPPSLS